MTPIVTISEGRRADRGGDPADVDVEERQADADREGIDAGREPGQREHPERMAGAACLAGLISGAAGRRRSSGRRARRAARRRSSGPSADVLAPPSRPPADHRRAASMAPKIAPVRSASRQSAGAGRRPCRPRRRRRRSTWRMRWRRRRAGSWQGASLECNARPPNRSSCRNDVHGSCSREAHSRCSSPRLRRSGDAHAARSPTRSSRRRPDRLGRPFGGLYRGDYYYCRSSRRAIGVARARRLQDIGAAPMVSCFGLRPERRTAARSGRRSFSDRGRWYIYFAASDGADANHRMYVLRRRLRSARAYVLKGRVADDIGPAWAIDGVALDLRGGSTSSGRAGRTARSFPAAALHRSDARPLTIVGADMSLPRPSTPGNARVAAPRRTPQPLRHRVALHSCIRPCELERRLRARPALYCGGDPPAPTLWQKQPLPVFTKDVAAGGVRCRPRELRASPTAGGLDRLSRDRRPGAGWLRRSVRAQPFDWSRDGRPEFGTPIAIGRPLEEPSGTPAAPRERARPRSLQRRAGGRRRRGRREPEHEQQVVRGHGDALAQRRARRSASARRRRRGGASPRRRRARAGRRRRRLARRGRLAVDDVGAVEDEHAVRREVPGGAPHQRRARRPRRDVQHVGAEDRVETAGTPGQVGAARRATIAGRTLARPAQRGRSTPARRARHRSVAIATRQGGGEVRRVLAGAAGDLEGVAASGKTRSTRRG